MPAGPKRPVHTCRQCAAGSAGEAPTRRGRPSHASLQDFREEDDNGRR